MYVKKLGQGLGFSRHPKMAYILQMHWGEFEALETDELVFGI